jgi:hypothetical protein
MPGAVSVPSSPPKALWYIGDDGKPDCLLVTAGISDGSSTEILPWGGEGEGALLGLKVILKEKI